MGASADFRMEGGNYAFGEPVAARLLGEGADVYLWVGLDNKNHSCLGVLQGVALLRLAEEIIRRKRGSSLAPGRPALGRTAEPLAGPRPEGRRGRAP